MADESSTPPCPPTPQSEGELGFVRQQMVRWLSPSGLVSTAAQSSLAGLFGQYADRRELQAALQEPHEADFSGREELWIDFVADTGDGFDATYTIARLVGDQQRTLSHGDDSYQTRAGDLLVLGGDLTYPVASEQRYRDRLTGPFQAALPCARPESPRWVFALPGNHDWYDGLTTFLRLFCQPGWLGGWRHEQTRSYFAVRLPHRWWLWGIDIQLDFYIDQPQLSYFERVADEWLRPDDGVILCTAKPAWVEDDLAGDKAEPHARRNLEYFEHRVLASRGIRPAVTLTGDLHHYARYTAREASGEEAGRRHKITAGGGGAFLYPTHTLPEVVQWPAAVRGEEPRAQWYERAGVFPDRTTSRRLSGGALWAPFKNPSFLVLLGAVYAALAWIAQASLGGESVAAALEQATIPDLVTALTRSPLGVLVAACLLVGLVGFAKAGTGGARLAMGTVHWLAHLAAALVATRLVAAALGGLDGFWFALLFVVVLAVFGGALAGLVFGVYLIVAHVVLGEHANEAFSAQRIPDYKSFVRLHIDEEGTLTVFPVGVTRVPREWRLRVEASSGEPWFDAVDTPIAPHLIESPLSIPRKR